MRRRTAIPRIRKYLALAIGRLDPPLPAEAVQVLLRSLDDPEKPWTPDAWSKINGWTPQMAEAHISTIWALGASGDPAVVAKLQPLYESPDAGVRKMVVYALGALAGRRAARRRCARRCRMPRPTCAGMPRSRWRATATSEGVGVLRQMLDRGLRRADGQARRAAGRRSGSDRGRDDQRPAGGRVAEGRVPADRRSRR